jgi:plasmid replication initiation protein
MNHQLATLDDASLKDERVLMEYPFFSLEKAPRTTPIIYQDGDELQIRVEPSREEVGIATIWDKGILIYVASLLNDLIERGQPHSPTVTFPARDCLTAIGWNDSGAAYQAFRAALERLRLTSVYTTIKAGGSIEEGAAGWVTDWRILRDDRNGRSVMVGVEVTLNRWLYRAIVKDRRVLTIDPGYFHLTMGLERRLYEIARKHCGQQKRWQIGLPRLAEKCGTTSELRFFRRDLQKVIERARLPEYEIALIVPAKGRKLENLQVLFTRRQPVEDA